MIGWRYSAIHPYSFQEYILWTAGRQKGFIISYLTGKRRWTGEIITNCPPLRLCFHSIFSNPFSMLLVFFCYLIAFGASLNYWNDCRIYLYACLTLNCCVDVYTTSFFALLLVISSRVFIWSYYYMDRDEGYARFIRLLMAFLLSMVVLIFIRNLFMALIGWDGLGVTSFLLIVYYKNRKRLGSALITALTNRIGDCFLFCLLGFLLWHNHNMVLALIIIMCITKSAQIPFSSWLPAAMAAPTPVRALVHSSTLVTAGVYVLIRYCNHDLTSMLIIGSCTIIIAGLRACAERDLKKVVALRTLSQLGVMMVSLGVQEKTFCFFHLISHACFKALLFISVGVRIHITYGSQEFRGFKILDASLYVSLIARLSSLSLLGFPYTSGFYSKDIILELLSLRGHSFTIGLFLIGIGLTTLYSFKLVTRTLFSRSFAGASSLAAGGYVWPLKLTLTPLGFMALCLGCKIRSYCNYVRITLPFQDKIASIFALAIGVMMGHKMSRLTLPAMVSIFCLTPRTQTIAYWGVPVGDLQKRTEKGWVHGISISFTPFSTTLYTWSGPLMGVGLSLIFLYIII